MDWSAQAEEMMQAWVNTQKKMWDAFNAAMPTMEKTPSQKAWEQMIAFGEETVKNALETQATWMKTWADSLARMPNMPEPALQSMAQFQEMMDRWSQIQAQSWKAWFDMLKSFDPSRMAGTWPQATLNPFTAWQESTQKLMEAQLDWMRTWTQQAGQKGK